MLTKHEKNAYKKLFSLTVKFSVINQLQYPALPLSTVNNDLILNKLSWVVEACKHKSNVNQIQILCSRRKY